MAERQDTPEAGAEPAPTSLVECIHRIGRMMERVDDPNRLLRAILEECRGLLRCEAASLALIDRDSGQLRFVVAVGGSQEGIRDWRVPAGQGIVGAVAASGEPTISNDPKSDSRWYGDITGEGGFVTRNLAAAAMRRADGVLGVLEALNRAENNPFAESDLQLLQIFADQAAVAIEVQELIAAKANSDRLAGFAVGLADSAHSVKNILSRLKMPAHMIEMGCRESNWEFVREPWRILNKATREINDLVLDMLAFSKAREPFLATLDVVEWVADIVETCRDDARSKAIELEIQASEKPFFWALDATILSPALHNLIGNAIEALAGAGCEAGRIVVGAKREGDSLRLTVGDNGPGIPAAIVPCLFEPFFTHGKAKGTGLGLANVKKGVEEHGGRVELDTEVGRGTTFTMILPKQEPHETKPCEEG